MLKSLKVAFDAFLAMEFTGNLAWKPFYFLGYDNSPAKARS